MDRLVDAIGILEALEALGLDVFLRTILDPRTRYIVELRFDERRAKLEVGDRLYLYLYCEPEAYYPCSRLGLCMHMPYLTGQLPSCAL